MTESELRAIRRSSMARILCDNSQVSLMAMMVMVVTMMMMMMMMVMVMVNHNNYKFITGG